jgi:hypothetical protein
MEYEPEMRERRWPIRNDRRPSAELMDGPVDVSEGLAATDLADDAAVQAAVEDEMASEVVPDFSVDAKQFGTKVGKRAEDYGLDPSEPSARQFVSDRISDIRYHPDGVRQGGWNPNGGGSSDYLFFRRASDVVVTQGDRQFVTILKDGLTNGWFQKAAPWGE